MNHDRMIVPPGKRIRLRDYDPKFTGPFKSKEAAVKKLARDVDEIAKLQDVLYAQDTYAILMIFQAMDAAGKDGAIKHVMSGINPQGCQVFSFKAPSAEELDHDYMWRCMKAMPERGRIGIFNRSYYEETLVLRVHPEFLVKEKLPPQARGEKFWKERFRDINDLERYLVRNGIIILKFFLNISKEEQRQRFLKRIEDPDKNWKFSSADAKEREHWDDYMKAYEETFSHTSTKWAPWYILPADHKWFTRAAVSDILHRTLKRLDMSYPKVTKEHKAELLKIRRQLVKNGH